MKEVYKAALTNNLSFIEDYVKKNPTQIDVGCDGITFDDVLEIERQNTKKQELEATFLDVAIEWVFKLPIVDTVVKSALEYTPFPALVRKQRELLHEDYKATLKTYNNFKGWTPLQFAAAGDSLEVAMCLIENKADTNNSFLQIAKDLGHEKFYKTCQTILALGKLTHERNTLAKNQVVLEDNQRKLTDNQRKLEDEVNKHSAARAVLKAGADNLQKEITDLKSENQDLESEIKDLEQKISQLKLERGVLENKHSEECSKFKREFDILNNQMALLEKTFDEFKIADENIEHTNGNSEHTSVFRHMLG